MMVNPSERLNAFRGLDIFRALSFNRPWRLVPQHMFQLSRALITVGLACGSVVLLLVVWQLAALISGDLPAPWPTLQTLARLLGDPLYDRGPNEKGIALQIGASLGRVFLGWAIGSLIAIPLGLAMGSNRWVTSLTNPMIQLLRPISPLAWFPIGMAMLQSSANATLYVIVITSLWPTVLNTIHGVTSVPNDYRNVARVFNFSRWQYLHQVLLPYSLGHILTGMRLSLSTAWLVIVAAEMLAGGTGIGYFIADAYYTGLMPQLMSALLIIGLLGLILDRGLEGLTRRLAPIV